MYSDYDFYSLYKVVLNNIHHPWKYNHRHRGLYARYHHNYVQVPIFYMNDQRYHHARNNYYGWVEPHHMPGNNGRPPSREFSKNTRNGRISHDSRPPANTVRSRSSAATHNDAGKSPSASSRPNSRSSAKDATVNNNSRSAADSKSSTDARTDRKDAPAVNSKRSSSGPSVSGNTRRSESKSSQNESTKGTSRSSTESKRSSGRK
jgi:hypothetical protein